MPGDASVWLHPRAEFRLTGNSTRRGGPTSHWLATRSYCNAQPIGQTRPEPTLPVIEVSRLSPIPASQYALLVPEIHGLRMRDLDEVGRRMCIRTVTGCHRTVTNLGVTRTAGTGLSRRNLLNLRISDAGAKKGGGRRRPFAWLQPICSARKPGK